MVSKILELSLCRVADVSGNGVVIAINFSTWSNKCQMEKSGRIAKELAQFLTVIYLSSAGLPLVAHTLSTF